MNRSAIDSAGVTVLHFLPPAPPLLLLLPLLLTYCLAPPITPVSSQLEYKGSNHANELNVLLSHCFMIRRRKADVLAELPQSARSSVYIAAATGLTTEDQADMALLESELGRGFDDKGELKLSVTARDKLVRLFGQSALLKQAAVLDYLDDNLLQQPHETPEVPQSVSVAAAVFVVVCFVRSASFPSRSRCDVVRCE